MISRDTYAKALRESNRLSKLIGAAAEEINRGIVKTYGLRSQGPARLNMTQGGILLTEGSSWVGSFVNRKTGIVQFMEVFQELCSEIAKCRQHNLTMMGLRLLYDLYEKNLSMLFYASDSEVEKALARYHFLTAIVANGKETNKMAHHIRNKYARDPVIEKFNMAEYGRPEFIKAASNKLATGTFSGAFTKYTIADKELMDGLILLLHGYVHANPSSFRGGESSK